MNITNIKKEIIRFMNNMNYEVVDISYVPGIVQTCVDEFTGDEYEELTDDTMNVKLTKDLVLDDFQEQRLNEFEAYIYFSYHNIVINYTT